MAKANKLEALIDKYMETGKYSLAEAKELAEWDLESDAMTVGEIHAEMTPEERKATKAATKVSRVPGNKEKKTRKPRKEDPEKRELVGLIAKALADAGYANVNISNPEKIVDFTIGDAEFSFSLIKHRAKKD